MFKISGSEFGTVSMHRRIFRMVSEGVVCGLYKVVTFLCFGVTCLCNSKHKVKINEGCLSMTHIYTTLILLPSCYLWLHTMSNNQWPYVSFLVFIYLGFYVTFNTVQVISRQVVDRAEETSTYSLSGFCTVNCRPTASNYQLSHLRLCMEPNPSLGGGRRECYHSAT